MNNFDFKALLLGCYCLCSVAFMVDASGQVAGGVEARQQFQEIASKLDPGGDLFLVLNGGRWLDRLMDSVLPESDAPLTSAEELDEQDLVERVRRFVNRQGIGGLLGLGVSTLPLGDGDARLKVYLSRDPIDAGLPFWRGFFGWQPRRLLTLDFVPGDAEFVWAATVDLGTVWQLVKDAEATIGTDDLSAFVSEMERWSSSQLGISLDDLTATLRDELMVVVRFDRSPGALGEVVSGLPAIEWAVAVGTGHSALLEATKSYYTNRMETFSSQTVAGIALHQVQGEAPSAAFVSVPGFFVWGSSGEIVKDALLAHSHRNGLTARAAFTDAFSGVSMVNNGVIYVSEDAAALWRHILESRQGQSLFPPESPLRGVGDLLSMGGSATPTLALTIQNWRQGVMVMGRSGVSGESLGMMMSAYPLRGWFAVVRWLTAQLD